MSVIEKKPGAVARHASHRAWERYSLAALERSGRIKLSRGNVISKVDIAKTPGDYPIYSSSVHRQGLFGRYGCYMFDDERISWSIDGGGHFFYREPHRYSVTNVCGHLLVLDPSISTRFLAFQLQRLHASQSFDYTLKAHPSVIRGLYTVSLPAPSEQRAIAAALSDVDDLLQSLNRLIAKKRDVKQGAMQQLLTGATRLPGFEGAWETKRLGGLFDFKNGLNKGKEFFGFGTLIVNYMDVYSSTGLRSSDLHGRVTVTSDEKKRFSARVGDVFFTRTSETTEEIGVSATLLDNPSDAVFSGFVLRARPKTTELRTEFCRYCFSSVSVRKQIVARATYTTRALTNGRALARVVLRVPSPSEQVAIAAVLSDMDAEIDALEARRGKVAAIKQGMMQELLTGRTRLPIPEEAIDA